MEHHKTNYKFGILFSIVVILISGIGLQSCYFDNQEELYPLDNCVVSEVSYINDVLPIITNSCYSCHDFSNAPVLGDGINLEGYDKFKRYAESNTGKLLGALKWNGQGELMPKDGTRLDGCLINKIETWMIEGYKNN